MKLVYASRTGHIEGVVNQLGHDDVLKLVDGSETVDGPFVLFTYTDKVGEVPAPVQKFLDANSQNLRAVIGSGSRQYHSETFNFAAKKISAAYSVPLVRTLDMSGTAEDVEAIKNYLA